ncbi:probable nitrilase (NIT3) [Cephalotrichum gorgonifer]|uniref:Probable nitrilase (NIT3) n=1 Tax=Cephalotrichum gorgonifer TaxID=2041049 RepID=A0AAE8MQ65_9PEZI|nr:probable nitrilase (NIT3) [Cephalotrichum gorgonifer]
MSAPAPAPSPVLRRPVKLACIQLATTASKDANLSHAREKVLEAAAAGAKIVVLPECFNSPYGTSFFPTYAETLPSPPPSPSAAPSDVPPAQSSPSSSSSSSPSFAALSRMAADAGVYLVGGSVPELEASSGKLYNTSLVFSPAGDLMARHRKIHLFDIDIPGKITFRESDVLSPGSDVTIVDLPEYGKLMVTICYDVRFPELAAIAARRGCFALVSPGAFNTTTGPLHWALLARARAVDNQMYVAFCSPARDMDAGYHAWGHSLVADPMAEIVVEAGEGEEIVYWEMDGKAIEDARTGIPVRTQRRFDVYPDVSETS